MNPDSYILTINGGSSSIKFSFYLIEETLTQSMHGEIENMNSKNATLIFTSSTEQKRTINIPATNNNDAANYLLDWLHKQDAFSSVKAIGHRIVHGMQHTKPEEITDSLIAALKKISAYDPEHLPGEIRLIELFRERYPELLQIACFDTSFHTSMPQVAKLLPIPRSYQSKGIQRYGFHGLSYAYLIEEFKRIAGPEKARGKIIIAHLGNGASLAAIRDGKSIDTSMGFTPTSGIPMSTRTGDLDPGVTAYLMQNDKMSPEEFSHLTNHQSGLLGISETTSDMRELEKIKDTDIRALEAIELFCYQAKKWIGSFAAALGGLDTLIFSGGIGENAPEVRARICSGLQFLGIDIDEESNVRNEAIISIETAKVPVYVIRTNEELMIARLVRDVLPQTIKK